MITGKLELSDCEVVLVGDQDPQIIPQIGKLDPHDLNCIFRGIHLVIMSTICGEPLAYSISLRLSGGGPVLKSWFGEDLGKPLSTGHMQEAVDTFNKNWRLA